MKTQNNYLLLYLSCFIIFNIALGITTLMWFAGFFINGMLMIFSVMLLIVAFMDYKKNRHQKAKVLFVVFSIFWMSYLLQGFVKYQIEKSGERKGELLVERLEAYRDTHNKYPKNIDSEEFKDLNLDHKFKSRIQYEYINDDNFIVKFHTFNVTYKIYDDNGRWFYDDD